jgi:WD40 repeat protein
MGYVFISYSRDDQEYVDRLVAHLDSFGLEVWVDREDIPVGTPYRRIIQNAIDGCDAVVLVMTKSSQASASVNDELDWARIQAKPILPLLLGGGLWFSMTQVHYEDVSDGDLPSDPFVARVRELATSSGTKVPAAAVPKATLRPGTAPGTVRRLFSRMASTTTSKLFRRIQRLAFLGVLVLAGSVVLASFLGRGPDDKSLDDKAGPQVTPTPQTSAATTTTTVATTTTVRDGPFQLLSSIETDREVWTVAFQPGGSLVVSGGSDGRIKYWDPETGELLKGPLERAHTGATRSLVFLGDDLLLSGGEDGMLALWDVETAALLQRIESAHAGALNKIVFDGSDLVISAGDDGALRSWMLAGRSLLRLDAVENAHDGRPIRDVVFSTNRKRLASGGDDSVVRLWEIDSGFSAGRELRGHRNGITALAFGRSDGILLAADTLPQENPRADPGVSSIRAWDLDSGDERYRVEPNDDVVNAMVFLAGGEEFIVASDDDTLRYFRAFRGTEVHSPILDHGGGVLSLDYDLRSQRLVSGSWNGSILVWESS